MTAGAMTWTCVLLTAAAAQPDVWHMNQKAFQIPIRIDAARRAEIHELDLWVSHDQGQTWNLEGRATPDKEYFPYAAKEDGPYWFTVAVVDQKGKQEPTNVQTAPVGQRIMVDTVKPDVKLTAERQGDVVRVDWQITELHPNPDTLKLEYAEKPEGPWTAVSIKAGPSGHAEIPTEAAVTVRMQMQDMAENVGLALKQVPGAVGGAAFVPPPPPPLTGPTPPATGVGAAAPTLPPELPGPAAVDHSHDVSKWTERSQDLPPIGPPPPPPASGPTPPVMGTNDILPTMPPPPAPGPGTLAVASRGNGAGNQVVAYTPTPGPTPPPAPPLSSGPDAPAGIPGGMPALQIVNKRQVKLEFDVGKFGPSGLGGVDVYVTMDDGATWQRATAEPNSVTLPAAAAANGAAVHGSVTVQLNTEGVTYGYYVVVRSRANLGKPAPRAGDRPQLRVELDATPPSAKLFKPQADPSRRDTLDLTWEASDKNLTAKPVTLEWSAQPGPDAQWTPIGEPEMANTGHYAWQPAADVPPNVYLRLTVRDVAGNKSVAQTAEPELIDLSVPEVTNLGLGGVSLGNGPR